MCDVARFHQYSDLTDPCQVSRKVILLLVSKANYLSSATFDLHMATTVEAEEHGTLLRQKGYLTCFRRNPLVMGN